MFPPATPALTAAVEYVEPVYLRKLFDERTVTPNDPLVPSQWALPAISATRAWFTSTGSPGVKVCVIDTGSRSGHQDLANGEEGQPCGGWAAEPRLGQCTGPAVHGLAAGCNTWCSHLVWWRAVVTGWNRVPELSDAGDVLYYPGPGNATYSDWEDRCVCCWVCACVCCWVCAYVFSWACACGLLGPSAWQAVARQTCCPCD